jgi:hypothetical protein
VTLGIGAQIGPYEVLALSAARLRTMTTWTAVAMRSGDDQNPGIGRSKRTVGTVRPAMVPAMWAAPLYRGRGSRLNRDVAITSAIPQAGVPFARPPRTRWRAWAGAVRVTTWRLGQATARFIALSLAGRTLEVRYGFVTTKVPVVEFDGIDIDQVPLTESLRVIEDGLAARTRATAFPSLRSTPSRSCNCSRDAAQDMADEEGAYKRDARRTYTRLPAGRGCSHILSSRE